MGQSIITDNLQVSGTLSCNLFTPPVGCIDDDAIEGNAGISYTKLQQKHVIRHSQKAGTAVVTETVPIHIADAAGEVLSIAVVPITPPTSTDTVIVDLKKGNAATPYATVLTSPITINNASVTRTVYDAVPSSASYVADDSYELVITVTGTSAQGLVITTTFAQAAM